MGQSHIGRIPVHSGACPHASRDPRLTGHVHDSNGQPVPKARVTFIGWADATVEQEIATTDARGEFTWDAAPSDQIGLTFTANGFAPSTEWVPAEKKDTMQVELRGRGEQAGGAPRSGFAH